MKATTKARISDTKALYRKFTFTTRGTPKKDFQGVVKDEQGRNVFIVLDDQDFNTLSLIISAGKFMSDRHDMKGLARYLWERNLFQVDKSFRQDCDKKRIVPVEIKEIRQ